MVTLLAYADAVDIGGGRGRLAGPAAASLRRVDAQLGRFLDINEAWRSPEDADENYRRYQAYLNGTGPAAPIGLPASQSIHCRGYAIDTDDSGLVALLNDHGWFQTVYRGGVLVEAWHFEYDIVRDNHRYDTAGTGSTPFGGFLMALSDQQQAELYGWVQGLAFGDFPKAGDQPIKWWLQALGNSINDSIARTAAIQAGQILFPNAGYNAFDALANAVHGLGEPADIDEAAIAKALAPLLPSNVKALTDADLARIAKATADEADRRDRARLAN